MREHADVLDAPVSDQTPVCDETAPTSPHSGRAPGWDVLAVVGVVVAVARWWFASDRRVFHLAPDEAAQLAMARWLAGGTHWNMFDHSTWRPGLATLVSPIYWFTDDGTTLVRAALAINAIAGGLAAVVLARLAARTTTLGPRECGAAAIVIALLPPALSGSSFVWAEALVTLTFVASVWFLVRFVDERRLAPALAAVGCAVIGFAAHSRMLAVVGPAVLVPVFLLVWRRRWIDAVVIAAAGSVTTWSAFAYSELFYANVWEDPASNNTLRTVVRRLRDPVEVVDAVIGQAWYQLTWTFGLAGIGLALVIGATRRGARGCPHRWPGCCWPPPSPRSGCRRCSCRRAPARTTSSTAATTTPSCGHCWPSPPGVDHRGPGTASAGATPGWSAAPSPHSPPPGRSPGRSTATSCPTASAYGP